MALLQAGFAVVPSLPRSKEIRIHDWPNLQLTLEQLPQHFSAGQNVSINWKTSGGRCALDLDAIEAEELAPLLLPLDTPAFGRAGRLRQMIFECSAAAGFRLKHNSETLVEVLGGGCNSLAPGSTHPDGDPVQWCAGRSPTEHPPKKVTATRLQRFATILAGAALVLRFWRDVAGQGVRHEAALLLAGAMLHGGWTPAAVRRVLRSVCLVAADPEIKDRMTAVETTIRQQQTGQPFSGLPELSKALSPELTAALVQFWTLGAGAVPEIGAAPQRDNAVGEVVLTWASDVVEEKDPVALVRCAGCRQNHVACGRSRLRQEHSIHSGGCRVQHRFTVPWRHRNTCTAAGADLRGGRWRSRYETAATRSRRCRNLSKVAFLDLVQHGARQRYFTLADIPSLDALLTKYPGEFGLLVVDPIGSYLAGKDSHRDSDVRELLRPLAVLAEQHRIAVLLIAHLNKSSMQTAMNRITGAKAFVAAARLAWLVGKDPQDPDTVLMVQLKTNITERLDGLSYHVVKEVLPSGAEVSKIAWDDLPVKLTADELLRRPAGDSAPAERQQQAEQWLQQRLAAGPVAVRVLRDETDLQPFSMDTVKRAAKALGIRGEGEKKARVWMLPWSAVGRSGHGGFRWTETNRTRQSGRGAGAYGLANVQRPPMHSMHLCTYALLQQCKGAKAHGCSCSRLHLSFLSWWKGSNGAATCNALYALKPFCTFAACWP